MEWFLLTLLRLSLLGSLLAVLMLALRPLLRRWTSRRAAYYLWLLVLLRLCIPAGVSIPLPAADTGLPVHTAPALSDAPAYMPDTPSAPELSAGGTNVPIPAEQEQNSPISPLVPTQPSAPQPAELPMGPNLLPALVSPILRAGEWVLAAMASPALWVDIWALGAAVCLGRYGWGYARLSRAIRWSALAPAPEALALLRTLDPEGRVWMVQSPLASTPMLLGVLRPVIVLPVGITDAARLRDILAHELTHARRHDLLYKWFAAAVASLHWFNPLMILVRREISRACELACDEAVLRGMNDAARRHYGETLLALAAAPDRLPTLALCEEKAQLKERLVSIVKYKKRGPVALLLSLLLAVVIAGCAAVSGTEPSSIPSGAPDFGNTDAPLEDTPALLEDVTLYEASGMTIAFPNDVYDQLLIFPGENEVTLASVYEKASYEQAQADWGEETRAGFLFSITRSTQAQYEQFLMSDGSGQSFFARDDTYYYCWGTATDVQLYRSSGSFPEEAIEEWQALGQRLEDIQGDFTARNGLTPYADSEFFGRAFVYDGEHRYASFYMPYFDGASAISMTLVLSQPVKQGEGGIWCVERWYDEYRNGYYSLSIEGFPQDQGITAAEHFQQLQDAADAGTRPDLLDPQQAAAVWLQNYFGYTDVITATPEDVVLLEGEPAGKIWPRIRAVLEQEQDGYLTIVDFLDGAGYNSYRYEQPAYWTQQNQSLAWAASSRLYPILWCKAEPQTLNGAAVDYYHMPGPMSAPDSRVIFMEDGLVCIQEGDMEEWFRPLFPSDDPYGAMYSICQEWANYDDTEPRFTDEEVDAAIDAVRAKFEAWSASCTLGQINFDAAHSLRRTQRYLENGRGSVNGVAEENVIILTADFTTLDEAAVQGTGWEPNCTYDWNFILIRADAQSPWVVDDWGV